MKRFYTAAFLVIGGVAIGVTSYQSGNSHAPRGQIHCVNGHWEISNISFDGSNKNGAPIVTLDVECDVGAPRSSPALQLGPAR